jgi:hypothetical protein
MYIGPNIFPLGLKFNTLFLEATLPPGLAQYVGANPIVATLYVPTSQLSQAKANITKKGTAENIAYQKMLDIAKTLPK